MKSAMRLSASLLLLCALLKISQASCDKAKCAENETQTLTVSTTAVVFGSGSKCNLSTGNSFTGEGSLTGLTPGVVYAVFIGCFNCCHKITTKPETVVGLNITETTTSSISLSWTPLSNSPAYRVHYTNGTTYSNDLNVTVPNVTVTGLTAGVRYSFTVRAVANDNTTEGDNATVTGYTKPEKVGSPNVSSNDSSISLTWSPPPGEVLEYRVSWHNGGTMMDTSTTSLSAVLPNLISGTAYTIQIVAVNGAKELGEPHILTAATNPAAVKNLTITAVTSSSVSLNWIQPDGNASSYLVQWTLEGKNFNNTSNMTSFTIEDLIPGNQYSITVFAVVTNRGVGTSTTTFTRPVKPVDIVVNQRTTDKMTISWTLSKGRVDHFMVNISNEDLMYSNSSTTTDDTFVFTDLRPGREFAITVTAVAGAFREMSDQTSFATDPTPPGDIVVTQRTNSSLHLSWGTPLLMDDAPGITYHITYQSQTEGAAQNETSSDENVDLSSLLSGTNYTITVQTVGPQSLKSSERVTSAFTSPNPVFNLECSHKSTTSVTVAWSAPQGAQDYYMYRVQINGSAGALINDTTRTDLSGLEPGTRYNISIRTIATAEIHSMDEFTTCFTMPTAVLNLSVGNVTTTSVQLSWHKQNDYKSSYTYMVRALLDGMLVHNNTTNTQTYTFTDLDPGHFYTFVVITKWDGINSSEANTSTYTRPAVVTNILTTGTMDSLSVSWTSAEGQVDSYSVLLHSDKGPERNSTNLSNSTVNEVFEGLKAGVEYCVEVITLRGPFHSSSSRVCNATFPRPPGPITVQSQTVDSINFTWSLPEDMDHMEYNFSVSTFNGLVLTTENHFLLNNLLSGSPYDISVVTVGALNYESTAERSQNYTRPHPVTVLLNMTITTDTVTLFWKQRDSKPHYSYEVKSSISANPEIIEGTTKTFTGLDSGSSYNFTITTQTEDGTQAAPVTVSVFTRPHGVRQLQAETLNTTAVHLFFTEPLEYKPEYTYRAETSGCDTNRNETFAGNNTVISELTPGTECTFCVVVRAADGTEGEANCTAQYTKPETVQPRISSEGSNSSVRVSWDKPPGRVERFIVHLNSTSEPGKEEELSSSHTSFLFDGLSAGQIYRAMVTSQSGNFREQSEVVTSATFPNPPGPIEVLKKTNSSIDIRWGEAPRMSDVSFFYNLTIISPEGGEYISLNNTSHTFTSLLSGTPHNISVVTVGALDFQSELVQIHRVTTRPFDVRSLQVSGSITEDTLVATWVRPDQYQESYTFNVTLQGPGGPSTDVTEDDSFRFTGLVPGSRYSISVTTETSDGTQSDPRHTSACTKASPVLALKCVGPNTPTAELVLAWTCPPGDYSGFQVRADNIIKGQSSRDCTRTVSNLHHYTSYNMTVETQSCGPTSDQKTITCRTGITDPPAPENPQLVQITDKNHFRFSLKINSSLLNNTNGPIRYVGVLVTDSSPDDSDFRNYLGQTYNLWKERQTEAYLATVKETSLQTRSAETQLTINVGDGSSWEGYTNGPLTPNRKYQFAIVLFTDLNLTLNQLVDGSQSLVSSTQFSFSIDLPINPTVVGLAVGATLGIFCILFIVLLGFIIYWKRISKKESQEVQVVTLSTPVRVEEFEDYYKRQKADSNCGFAEEFEELKVVGIGQAKTHALAPENKPKNRYNNVLPYDSSRVKLSIIHGSPHDDYINANYMPGYNSSKEFIAAQGPLPQTVNEFWRMIWEKNVQTLVMLTRCNEQGRVKCEQYWEHGTKHFENIIVTTTSEIPLKDWTIRDFDVKNVKTAETRSVRHFHFTAWPDHGVPETTELLISFRHLVREHMDQYSRHSPAVVHCSAGVGRTGTLIAIDRLINQIERENLVDVYGIVRDLRMHRPLMVQTEDQYVFLNQCAMDIIRSRTGTNVDLIYQNMAALSIYENVEPKKGYNRNGYNNA